MALRDSTVEDGSLEECLDEINDFVQTLTRYPPRMIAMAIRAHLEVLLARNARVRFMYARGRSTVRARTAAGSAGGERRLITHAQPHAQSHVESHA